MQSYPLTLLQTHVLVLHMCMCVQSDDEEVVSEDVAQHYETRIAQQKAELEALVAQKEELLQLREMLRQLQVQEAKVLTLFTECSLPKMQPKQVVFVG